MGQEEGKDRELPEMAEVTCDHCSGARAVVYCRADSARLCLPCDRQVHGANAVCSRHARAPLCSACRAAGAVFRAVPDFLCSNCDFGMRSDSSLHDNRAAVQGYTGRPSAHDLAALLAVSDFDKPPTDAGGDGWWTIWDREDPHVFTMEDLIVPTTSCHGFHPLITPSSPKISLDGKMNEEVIRQLRELAESDCGGAQVTPREEAEHATDHQAASWAPLQYVTGNDSFGTENSHEVATMPTPGYETGGWNISDYHAPNDAYKIKYEDDQAPVKSSAETCLSSFVQMSEICPSMSNGSNYDDVHQANRSVGVTMQDFPKKTSFDVVSGAERDTVISRYKEKRKTRRFGKQVRYESRKARADSRLRIKGRFAKADQN